ncbi:hypothetical protein [Acutalibacter muris]|uniref:hypothetical protein n=1 Tax=Acutalibacter muris TaxID=1796620 RepID=UPI00272E95A6|nr:hypothetical protein [Acutalibacter muris]
MIECYHKKGVPDIIIKPSTALQNDYSEEVLKLRAKLAAAEQIRASGQGALSLEESRRRLEDIYNP